jgi:type II secretory ATPase GspE/PulE/Tfp pilus assembly ATPase PilB-like protein
VGIFEFLEVGAAVRAQIAESPDASQLRTVAASEGMRPLALDGRDKVLEGLTTPAEVLRAVVT